MLGSVGTGWSAYWGKKYSVQKKKQTKKNNQELNLVKKFACS